MKELTTNENEKVELMIKGAQLGDYTMQFDLANYYKTSEQHSEAIQWFLKALAHNNKKENLTIYNYLGNCYLEGSGLEKDIKKAQYWFEKSALKGNAYGQFGVASCHDENHSYTKAFEWYKKAADHGDSNALFNVAYCYEWGEGVEKDLSKSFEWFLKSAEKGDAEAQYRIGMRYTMGKGVERDLYKAFNWYYKSSKNGYINSMFQLGYMYASGKGTSFDGAKSLKWLSRASEGYEHAKTVIGFLNHFGLNSMSKELNYADQMNISESIKKNTIESLRKCGACDNICKGFFKSTLDGGLSFNVCNDCLKCMDLEQIKEKFKSEIGDRILYHTHYLANFLPLIIYCRDENKVVNSNLESFITQLEDCAKE
ncbi:predicted protein [Naegleria gruberi]|uniref:Predicted protein n=1 Tax=Naegleria gruberi TaxID=5762 RepID=D2VIG3_NAEGR|nr:uncharacterized protein NAEGRDRAFT_49810 [Naegleria gruberi]EFC43263.1 predicted protein [Naegleria gruberi]|eukprot:XP_002676007.1 predicted protein [Naegleria gruberi strain NEG-M]